MRAWFGIAAVAVACGGSPSAPVAPAPTAPPAPPPAPACVSTTDVVFGEGAALAASPAVPAEAAASTWPADVALEVTATYTAERAQVQAVVRNDGKAPRQLFFAEPAFTALPALKPSAATGPSVPPPGDTPRALTLAPGATATWTANVCLDPYVRPIPYTFDVSWTWAAWSAPRTGRVVARP